MKAVALVSGGLDSSIALELIAKQNIEVISLHFDTVFCCCDGKHGCGFYAKKASDHAGTNLKTVFIKEDYLEMVKKPKHGYGKNLNPCIDCRILKFKYAKKFMEEIGASFIITGEVVGQRPMSQHKWAFDLIEKESGLKSLVLRPLSAKILPPTIPEEKGWVDREQLLNVSGRGRRVQMDLAADFDIKDYPCPAGGCLLTDPQFSARLKDFMKYFDLTIKNVQFLKSGRYLRINPDLYFVVGRNEKENDQLMRLKDENNLVCEPIDVPGPTVVGIGKNLNEFYELGSQILAFYALKDKSKTIKVKAITQNVEKVLEVSAISDDRIKEYSV